MPLVWGPHNGDPARRVRAPQRPAVRPLQRRAGDDGAPARRAAGVPVHDRSELQEPGAPVLVGEGLPGAELGCAAEQQPSPAGSEQRQAAAAPRRRCAPMLPGGWKSSPS